MTGEMPAGVTQIILNVAPPPPPSDAPLFAPQVVTIPVKSGVTTYTVSTTLPAIAVSHTIDAGTTPSTLTFQLPGPGDVRHPATITIPAGAPSGMTVNVAPIPIGASPGQMRAQGGPPGDALASLGMFYVEFVDDVGDQMKPPAGTTVSIGAQTPPAIPNSDPLNAWMMNDQGNWGTPQPMTPPAPGAPSAPAPITNFGYWNSDRAFRTACIKGTLKSPSGTCGGAMLDLTGPDGIHSKDVSGDDGSFCLVGPQGHSGTLAGGRSVSFPGTAGNCSVPSSCTDVGSFNVGDAVCQSTPTPYTATFSCSVTSISDCILIADPYAPDSDDIPPTMADVPNPVTGTLTNLADCGASAQAAAASACANAAANISPDGNDIWACTVKYSPPTITNCHE